MAISGSVVGREIVVLLKQGATWGTEVTMGTGNGYGIYAEDWGLSFSQPLDDVPINTGVWGQEVDQGVISAALNPQMPITFDEIRLFAGVLGDGSYDTPAEVNAGKGDYQHIIYPSGDNFGDFWTIGIQKGNSIVQTIPSWKPTGFTISSTASPNRCMVQFQGVGNTVENNSSVITATAFTGVSYITGPSGRAYFRNARIYINDQTAATLATVDEISNLITSFEFTFNRNLSQDYTNTSGLKMEEPVEDGMVDVTAVLNFRNQDSTGSALFDDLTNGQKKKLKIAISGAAATSATGTVENAGFTLECPNVRVGDNDFPNVSGTGRQTSTFNLRALGAVAAGDAPGMDFLQPFKLTVVNAQSAKQVS
jgi:hypothetical protein